MQQFSQEIEGIRPLLLQTAQQRFRAPTLEDAEDLVGETTLMACHILDRYDPQKASLYAWLCGVMRYAVSKENRRRPSYVREVPLEAAAQVVAPPEPLPVHIADMLPADTELPRRYQQAVDLWMEGYRQIEIAKKMGVERNTVGIWLQNAFRMLRQEIPDALSIWYDSQEFRRSAKATVYRKPTSLSLRWHRRHPRDVPWSLLIKRGRVVRKYRVLKKRAA